MARLIAQNEFGTELIEVVKADAWNNGNGKEVMALLLDQRGADVRITEEMVYKSGVLEHSNGFFRWQLPPR